MGSNKTRIPKILKAFWSSSISCELEYRFNLFIEILSVVGNLMGSIFTLSLFVNIPLYEVTNLNHEIMQLKKNEFWIIGLENSINAKPWYDVEFSGKTVIVVGSEGRGIRHKVLKSCDFIATIPMQGKTNSLNVSAAVSAVAFERIRQLQKG